MNETIQDSNKKTHASGSGPQRLVALLVALGMTLVVLTAPAFAQDDEDEKQDLEIEFEPQSGPAGTSVWVHGEGFDDDTEVRFGGHDVPHERFSSDRIRFDALDFPSGEYIIEVETADGRGSACCFELTEEDTASNSTDDTNDTDGGGDGTDGSDGGSGDTGGSTNSGNTDQGVNEGECRESKMNVQCSEFGTITMPSQQTIRGEPLDLTIEIWLNKNYADEGGRFMLFSIWNMTEDGDSPVAIALDGFKTPNGDLITMRVEDDRPNELNLWVNVLDVPEETPITIDLRVGSTERGAYLLEALVMPFDRGYEPIKDRDGQDISLYSYTLLGVNDATSGDLAGDGGIFGDTPMVAPVVVVAALLGLAAIRSRGRRY